MVKRVRYQVLPTDGGDWKVQKTGGQRASAVVANKAEAIQEASRLAQRSPLSQVVIHKRDGTIQKEYTYGNDPRKYRG
jgi:hypothetical protein